jgi:ParB family chromosome partitioning protein
VRRIVNPFRCRIWTQHSRPEEQLTDDACKTLRESIARNGQHQPALGRPVSDDPDYDVEIICGARRHAVAHALKRDLVVEVRPMTDAEAYVAMYEENLLREGDSPYVRGQILVRALRSGTYSSQEELGRAFNLSHSAVSRLLMLAQLPSIIVAAFPSSDEIRETWGVELYRLWSNEDTRDGISARARSIARKTPRPRTREVYETLMSPSGGPRKPHRAYRIMPIRGTSHEVLFHEQDQLDRVMYIIPKQLLSPKRREALTQALVRILEERSAAI